MESIGCDSGYVSSLLVIYVGLYALHSIVGLVVLMPMFKLHSWVVSARLVICSNGLLYLVFINWIWFMQL